MKFNKLPAILIALITLTLLSAYVIPSSYDKEASVMVKELSDSTITDSANVTYTCPMHPEVTSDNPGQCPKCGMDLVPKKSDVKEEGMNNCPDMEKCKQTGCKMNDCKGHTGGCMNECPMMKDHKDHDKSKEHDHNSKDNDNGHQHKSGCSKKGC